MFDITAVACDDWPKTLSQNMEKHMKVRYASTMTIVFLFALAGCSTPDGENIIDDALEDKRADGAVLVTDTPDMESDEIPPQDVFVDTGPGPDGETEVWAFDAVEVDYLAPQGEPGSPCQTGDDCDSGFCIQTPAGKQCTQVCLEECPFDWVCVLHKPSLPDDVYLCVPLRMNLCKPCLKNSDCLTNGAETGDGCLPYGTAGSYCGAVCMGSGDCPEGFTCKQVLDVWGFESQQCVLDAGQCECEEWFVDEEATTVCSITNEFGSCDGERKCTVDGLSGCDAVAPAKESCNGEDDNCDGEVDEGAGGEVCFVENELGACMGVYTCENGKLSCDAPSPQAEICDGADNDCDGTKDEGFPDSDGDGMADCLENDKDGDGTMDFEDNCPYVANPNQADFDLDGMGNMCDPDDDNDMIADELDCNPLNSKIHPDAEEICNSKDDDCDALIDEGFPDSDSDALADCVDDDDDNDGFPDAGDCAPTKVDIYPGAKEICDGKDNDCDYDIDDGFADTDQDEIADCVDEDIDNDGKKNAIDNCPMVANENQEDLDGDGAGDACDPDVDGDGIPDGTDSCPLVYNPGQKDLDGDGAGDLCDDDWDGDELLNEDEDNCPWVANPDQEDQDEDGLGDACDADGDGDGDPDVTDCEPANPYVFAAAAEVCDGFDNNCNGLYDEGYPDLDADDIKNCVDIDDDDDGDDDLADCEPLNSAVHSQAVEVCNGVDDNCNSETDEGLGSLACGKGECFHTVDACQNGKAGQCDPMLGSDVESCDGLDNDCDGWTDEDLGWTTCGQGECKHTIEACLNGQVTQCDPFAGAGAEVCDGKDNDCNGKIDEDLGTVQCGKGECDHTVAACINGTPVECDAFAGSLPEVCDGKDNDCNGEADEGFPDTDADGFVDCLDKDDDGDDDPDLTDCSPLNKDIYTGATEFCDALDNNCDGHIDEAGAEGCQDYFADQDWDGHGAGDPLCLCAPTTLFKAQVDDDCNDLNPWTFPGATEMCDNVDNDCDEQIDEDGASGCNWLFEDTDGDGFGSGDPVCSCQAPAGGWAVMPGDCDETSSDVHPGALEFCDDLDNDCDNEIDETFELDSDVENCGECGTTCDPNNGFGECEEAECTIADCISGYKDCNENYEDGCEINVLQDAVNCGECKNVCALPHATEICSNGNCAVGGCDEHYTDQDSKADNGCEHLTYGKLQEDPGLSCYDVKTFDPTVANGNYWLDPNGGAHDDAFETYCYMLSPKNAPDYKLVTPTKFYHGDQHQKYGATNGLNIFDYGCDGCGAATQWYTYECPDANWEVHWYNIRSHCDHSSHKSDSVFTSESTAVNGVAAIRFRQASDNCGDPNEFTIVGVCRVTNTGAADPGSWEDHFKDVNWTN
jgi:hypothetical protein